jgi:uncharacterized protein (DUF433 family)
MTTQIPTVSVPLRYDDDGTIYIGQTKVMLELVIRAFQLGDSPEHIKENYSVLSLVDVYAVCTYYLQHRHEIDVYLNRQEDVEKRLVEEGRERYLLPETLKAKLRAFADQNTSS